MQRQSLGSPSTKHHLNEAHKPIPSPNTNTINNLFNEQEEEKKLKLKLKHNATTAETYIHVIPMLTLLCILILYLSSHPPSQNDMAQFDGFNHLHNAPDLRKLERKINIKKGDVIVAIRSLKNMDEIRNRRLNRKIGNV